MLRCCLSLWRYGADDPAVRGCRLRMSMGVMLSVGQPADGDERTALRSGPAASSGVVLLLPERNASAGGEAVPGSLVVGAGAHGRPRHAAQC